MAVDHGFRRVGVAVSDPLGLFARPLVTLDVRRTGDVAAEVARLAREHAVRVVVVGLPLLPSGDHGPQAEAATAFAAAVTAALANIDHEAQVGCFDESHTTAGAAALAAASGRQPRAGSDAAAAALILEEWLQARESEGRARAAGPQMNDVGAADPRGRS